MLKAMNLRKSALMVRTVAAGKVAVPHARYVYVAGGVSTGSYVG